MVKKVSLSIADIVDDYTREYMEKTGKTNYSEVTEEFIRLGQEVNKKMRVDNVLNQRKNINIIFFDLFKKQTANTNKRDRNVRGAVSSHNFNTFSYLGIEYIL